MNLFKTLLAGIALLGVGAVTTNAHAQGTTPTEKVTKPFSLKVGGLFFTDGDTKDAIGDSTVSLGVAYDFGKTATANPIVYGAYFDYFIRKSRDQNVSIGGVGNFSVHSSAEAFGLGVQGRYLFTPPSPTTSFSPYAGLGVGVYNARGKVDGFGSKNTTSIGGKVLLGAELKSGILGELEYDFIPKVKDFDAKLSGFGARIGYRF